MRIFVKTTVSIEDAHGREVWSLTEVTTKNNGDNPRFLGADAKSGMDKLGDVVKDVMESRFGKVPE